MIHILDRDSSRTEKTVICTNIVTIVIAVILLTYCIVIQIMEYQGQTLLEELNERAERVANRLSLAEWRYNMNLTAKNMDIQMTLEAEDGKQKTEAARRVSKLPWKRFSNFSLKRQLAYYAFVGDAALPSPKYVRLSEITNKMQTIYSTAKICSKNSNPGDNCTLSLEPNLTDILETSRDPEELKHVWVKWRDAVGPKCRSLYKEYVELSNEAARLNDASDMSEMWLGNYEDPDFKSIIDSLWDQVKPLYFQLHAYIRTKLREKYGDIVSERGPIPAHLLGDMWAQNWANIANFTLPHPDVKDSSDITEKLKENNYTEIEIFKRAEEFFKSINLTNMPSTFWIKSVLVKPPNTEMVCHASSWDFADRKDFRISQCSQVSGHHFVVAHHEMGHIEYFLQYKDQPYPFRQGANDGFHEAIGDLIALSVQSTKHLQKIGLYGIRDSKAILNNLFKLGLYQVAFLPFGYLTDLWRWDVFSGKIKFEDYNCKWWELREKYQGVEPPVQRSEKDFDPAAKFHIVADVPYLRYFISMVLQYQFHKSLCTKAGEYEKNNLEKLLAECDIYQNKEVGTILKSMLSMGSSRPWPEALEVITGQREMDASGILEYFKPLQDWLEKENAINNALIGWEPSKIACTRT